MKTRSWRQGSLVRVGLILLTLTSTSKFASGQAPVVLSGLVEFSTDTAGNFDNLSVWNARGGDSAVNLWVINGTNLLGPFVNGPSDAEAGISIPLSEGENQFVL